jgi:mannose-6-phosphate isomerase-like protein (cupin superfamily)
MTTVGVTLAEALGRLAAEEAGRSVRLFTYGSLEVKLYAPRGRDPQPPHTRDEIYVVAQGRGEFVLESERRQFAPGDFLFAPAGRAHRFEHFTDDFAVWVFFYGPEGGEVSTAQPPAAGVNE